MRTRKVFLAFSAVPLIALAACGNQGGSDEAMTKETTAAMSDSMTKETMTKDSDAMSKESDAMAKDSASMSKESDAMAKETDTMSKDAMDHGAMSHAGQFISYEDYQASMSGEAMSKGATVLFFNASWCPDCQAMKQDFSNDPSLIPEGVTVVDVDYDSHTDLRQKYGVTMQHTFVQVDEHGDAIKTWNATSTEKALMEVQQ